MPVVAPPGVVPIPPQQLKAAFERAGYTVVSRDRHNWSMARDEDEKPFLVPRLGRVVAREIMEQGMCLSDATLQSEILGACHMYIHPPVDVLDVIGSTTRPPSDPPDSK